MCTSVGVRMYFGRGTHVPRSGYDDNEAFLRRLSGEKEKTKHVKRRSATACVVFKDNIFFSFSLALFLKTIETIGTIFFYVKKLNRTYKILSLLSLLSLNFPQARTPENLSSLNLSQVIPTPAPSHRQGGRRAYSLFSSYQRSASL